MERIRTIEYHCSYDNSLQKAKSFIAEGGQKRPLLVALHTWSFTYEQGCDSYAKFCLENNWNFIFPDFRGPNWTASACGSDAVVSDIVDAVKYMKHVSLVDEDRVYLMGGSGGGHASLLLASRHPELWTAVSAWCPIFDVAAWHTECSAAKLAYSEHIEKACGGDPGKDQAVYAEALKRSSKAYIGGASRALVDISTGIHDGHVFNGRSGSVPVSHTLNAFNALAKPEDRISEEEVAFITAEQQIPEKFGEPEKDPSFGDNRVLLRRQSNLARVTIFEGGHDCLTGPGLAWLARQNRKAVPDWSIGSCSETGGQELGK